MSTLKVTAERLIVHEHPNADALELAQVGLYRAVVAKGAYRTGDYAIYIPEQAVLPADLIEELGLTGRLAGKEKDRVKAIRLRGELSQGIVCRPAAAIEALDGWRLADAAESGMDFAEILGITKWVPLIPASMRGEVTSAAGLLRWIEIENIKRYPDVFASGEQVVVTEKIHGSACLASYVRATGELLVSSKGQGSKNLALVESERNLYWRAVRAHGVADVAKALADLYMADRVGIFGEVYGPGVQDLGYGIDPKAQRPGYAVFDIAVDRGSGVEWVSSDEQHAVLRQVAPFESELALPVVKRLYRGPFDLDAILALADGREQMSGTEANIREGVVVRADIERRSDVLGGRAIVKAISAAYLTRKGGTEYE